MFQTGIQFLVRDSDYMNVKRWYIQTNKKKKNDFIS